MSTNLDKLMHMATLEQLNNMIQQMNKTALTPTPTEAKDVLSLPIVQKVILAYEDELKVSKNDCKCNKHNENILENLGKHERRLQRIESILNDIFSLLESKEKEKEPNYTHVFDKNQLKLSAFPGFCQKPSLFAAQEELKAREEVLQSQYTCLDSQYNCLEAQEEELKAQYTCLYSQEEELKIQEEELKIQEEELKTQYTCLDSQYNCLKEQYSCLKEQDCLEKENITLNIEEHDLEDVVEDVDVEEDLEDVVEDVDVEEDLEDVDVEEDVVEDVDVDVEEDVDEDLEDVEVESEAEVATDAEEDVVEVEEEEEVFEIEIDDITYFATDEENGILYEVDKDGEVGKKVGIIKDGEPIFS
jgi:hypothetical protein